MSSTVREATRSGAARRSTGGSDAALKAQGQFEYASDLHADGMLHGQTVRSPHPHARIVSIDTARARALPGVRAVLTHADVPGQRTYGIEFPDQPVLAFDRVRYRGEPVAIVAADEPAQARRAAAAVKVEYELMPVISDPERALESEPLHPDRPTMCERYRWDPRPNVVRHLVIRHGDPDAAGDVAVSGVYDIGMQDQAFLGPEAGMAVPDGEGGVDIHVATQWLHADRDQVAPCLGLAPEQVRVHLAGVGGAFGGREDLSMQIHGAMLALATGRPVRFVYARDESFVGHVHRHPAKLWAEHRATRDGRLVSVIVRILLDGGAYASTSGAVTGNAGCFACGPYAVPNALIEATSVYTNNPPCGAMRGFGAVQACFAAEAQMDRLATELGIDPIELRLRNALAPGDRLPTGQRITGSLPVAELIRRCAELPLPEPEPFPREIMRLPGGSGNVTRGEGVRRGVGFAVGFKNVGFPEGFDDQASARIRLVAERDGTMTATVFSAAVDVGQGARGVIRRVAERELAPMSDRILLGEQSTAAAGSAGSSSASRQTWMTAGAVQLACRAALDELDRRGGSFAPGEEVDVERVYRAPRTSALDPVDGQVRGERAHYGFICAAMRVVAEVDTELGLTRLAWIGTAQDVGRALDPQSVRGQIEGGTAQGVGLALMEEVVVVDGVIANASFTDYLVPTTLDVPQISSVLVERPEPAAPYGVKGVGEAPTVVSTAAIVAAIRDATGRPLTAVPIRPDHIVFGD